jgi:homoserine kinase type II
MAVYTEICGDELIAFCAAYDLGKVLSYAGIAEGIENSNYLLNLTSGPYILTLYEKRVKLSDLPFFLNLMNHLAKAGVSCPRPIATRDGTVLRELAGRPCALISFMDGVSPKYPRPYHCGKLGRVLAEFHLAGANFDLSRPNNLSVASWRGLLKSCGPSVNNLRPGFYDLLENEISILEQEWPLDLPSGIIHGDLFPDNVFFHGEHLTGIIDFYFSCKDSYIYDLAVCLNAWCFELNNSFNITKAQILLENYSAVRNISQIEIDALPVLTRGAALRFLLTRLYDWTHTSKNALVTLKDPMEYWGKFEFHKAASSPCDYGWHL